MESITIQPVAPYWIIAVILAVILAAMWMGPRFEQLSRRQRRTLFGLRAALVLLVVAALLRPALLSSVKQKQTGVVAVAMDFSRSMVLPHLATGPTRWESLRQMINDCAPAVERLREQNIDVRFYQFGTSLKRIEFDGTVPEFPEFPPDSETDLGSAIYSLIEEVRDQRLLAMILPSDGVHNASDPLVELEQAGRLLEDSQIPLLTIPFGQSLETREFADVAVENMADQFSMWVKNDLIVTASVRARGFANQEVPVQLIVTDRAGNSIVADTVRPRFTQQSESVNVELKYTADLPGQYRLTVRAEPQPGEVSPRNNELPGFLTVNEGGLRVLYVYGSLNWEQAFLRRSLGGYQDIQLDELYIDSRNRERRPPDLAAAFGDPRYDVFILHDVDSRLLFTRDRDETSLNVLTDAVLGGKGLMMIGGYHSFGPGLYAQTPLANILPVEMTITEKQDFDAPIRADVHIDRELRPVVSQRHFVTQLGDPDENASIWASLPPLAGANRFSGIKSSASVLLETSGGDPLLVSARVGGRVLAFAGDSTYKWWGHGQRELHRKFWRQVVLWLAFKDNMSGDNVRIDLPQRRFQPNATIRFTTEASSSTNEQINDATFTGNLVDPQGESSPINILGGGQSRIDRELVEKPGVYTIEVAATRHGESIGEAAAEFVIFDNDKETANPAADIDQLNRLSQRTAEWGGRMIAPDDLPATLNELAELAPTLEIDVPLQWQLGDTWYDALLYVLAFTGLLATEWWLRKKWNLV